MKPLVVMTTAPRAEPTIKQSVVSLRRAGYEPVIFAEPGCEDQLQESPVNECFIHYNEEKLGIWYNWLQAAEWAVTQEADYILSVQDDIRIHPGTKDFLDGTLWPNDNVGFVSLYTSTHHSDSMAEGKKMHGFCTHNTNTLWGGCALVFPPQVLADLLITETVQEWKGVPTQYLAPHEIKNSDTVIGCAIGKLVKHMYFMWPSLVIHTGKISSVGNGDDTGKRNCSPKPNFDIPIDYQMSRPTAAYTEDGVPKKTGNKVYDNAVLDHWLGGFQMSFAINQELWNAIDAVLVRGGRTLEFGSGLSTRLFKYYSQHHTALEQNAKIAKTTSTLYCPLTKRDFYSIKGLNGKYDVILVDGPYGGDRTQAIPFLKSQLSQGAVVFIDDVQRDDGKAIFMALQEQQGESKVTKRWAVCYPTLVNK